MSDLVSNKLVPGKLYDLRLLRSNDIESESKFVDINNGRVVFFGDDSGAKEVLLYLTNERVGLFHDYDHLYQILAPMGLLNVSLRGVQFLLRLGFIPHPYSVYDNVFSLGVGDRIQAELLESRYEYNVEYPYCVDEAGGDSKYNESDIKRLLVNSINNQLDTDKDIFVMQSGGKDSTTMMLALKEAEINNRDVLCATYDSNSYKEGEHAKKIANYLGFSHSTIEMNPRSEFKSVLDYCERSHSLSCDHTLGAYNFTLDTCSIKSMNVVDGGGNDSYMGYLMPQKEIRHTDYAFAQYLPWIWGASEGIGESEKWINIQRVLMKYPAEIIFPAGGLSVSAIRNLTDGRVHMREIFEGLKNKYKKLSAIDYRGYVRGRLYDSPCISGKVRTSASAHKCNVVYPFCDSDFIEYYYNLPAELKYEYEPDSDVLVNKVALREFCEGNLPHSLLKYVVDNKGFFKFDPVEFVNANLDLIKEEVVRSAPYFRNVDNLWGFLEARRHNIFFAYEIYTLSCVVAWLNRRPSDVGIDLSGQNDEQEMIFAF